MVDPRLFRGRIERFRLVRRVDWDLAASLAELDREVASSTGVPVMMMQSDRYRYLQTKWFGSPEGG